LTSLLTVVITRTINIKKKKHTHTHTDEDEDTDTSRKQNKTKKKYTVMVDFGKKLLEKRVDGWEEYYIDYGRLKSLIKKASKAKKRKQVQKVVEQQTRQRQRSNSNVTGGGYNYNFNGLTRRNNGNGNGNGSGSSSQDLGSKSTGLIDRMTQMSPSMRGRLFNNDNNNDDYYESSDDITNTNTNTNTNTSSSRRKSVSETVSDEYVTVLEFRQVLDYEIQKIVLFILTREGQLAEILYKLSIDGQILKTNILSLVYNYRNQNTTTNTTTTTTTNINQNNHNNNQNLNNIGIIVNENDKSNAWNHLEQSTYSHRNFASDLLQFVNFIDMNVTGKVYYYTHKKCRVSQSVRRVESGGTS
jgi:hypothetical protein